MIFFSWVDKTDNVFGEPHQIEDENIFSLRLQQSEHGFGSLEMEIENPRVGLLSDEREQWGWLSWQRPDGEVTALFFGRIMAVPQRLEGEIIVINLLARPDDFEEQKQDVADQMKVFPWFDPLWFDLAERDDPDSVLEGYNMLWDIDRVTGVVSASSITQGDETLLFTEDDAFYDSVSFTHTGSPKRRAIVEATVQWDQRGAGDLDLTPLMIAAFGKTSPPSIVKAQGELISSEGMIAITAGEEMVQNWPQYGTQIGGGWTVGDTIIGPIGKRPTQSIISTWNQFSDIQVKMARDGAQANPLFGDGVGYAVKVERNSFSPDTISPGFMDLGAGLTADILWVPVWRLAATLPVEWKVSRARTEVVRFTVDANVQPLLAAPGEEEIIRLNFGPVAVDEVLDEDGVSGSTDSTGTGSEGTSGTEAPDAAINTPIRDYRRSSYFKTERGQISFSHLLARVRAELLSRARAAECSWESTWEHVVEANCRKSATLVDARLPGGQATGKIKHYSLVRDGDTGDMFGSVTIGCTVGREGTVEIDEGVPVYAAAGYVKSGYQVQENAVHVPLAGDLGYTDYTLQAIDDDGVDLTAINMLDYVVSLSITGGLIKEQEAVEKNTLKSGDLGLGLVTQNGLLISKGGFSSAAGAVEKISAVETRIRLEMKSLTGGPFVTILNPVVTELMIPRTVNVE